MSSRRRRRFECRKMRRGQSNSHAKKTSTAEDQSCPTLPSSIGVTYSSTSFVGKGRRGSKRPLPETVNRPSTARDENRRDDRDAYLAELAQGRSLYGRRRSRPPWPMRSRASSDTNTTATASRHWIANDGWALTDSCPCKKLTSWKEIAQCPLLNLSAQEAQRLELPTPEVAPFCRTIQSR